MFPGETIFDSCFSPQILHRAGCHGHPCPHISGLPPLSIVRVAGASSCCSMSPPTCIHARFRPQGISVRADGAGDDVKQWSALVSVIRGRCIGRCVRSSSQPRAPPRQGHLLSQLWLHVRCHHQQKSGTSPPLLSHDALSPPVTRHMMLAEASMFNAYILSPRSSSADACL